MFQDFKDDMEKSAQVFDSAQDLSSLIEHIKDRKVVMLGEASHGTHEYYKWRALITEELIKNHGFRFVAVEGDWPPCQQVHSYLRGDSLGNARQVLRHFERWPTWMWANLETEAFVTRLKDYNKQTGARIGFHGLDVYSLFESIEEALSKASRVSPDLSKFLKDKYACFEPYHRDEKKYLRNLARFSDTCEQEVLEALKVLLEKRLHTSSYGSETLFDIIQNARIIKNAETYYRAMIFAEESSWNVRDRHMMETLEILLNHYGPSAKGIVWAHNTHIGDYKATNMAQRGDINVGGLAREILGEDQVALVGFGSYKGSVIASQSWGGRIQKMKVPPAMHGSYEAIFHEISKALEASQFYFLFDKNSSSAWTERRGHRAIGVIYEPDYEYGNYVPTEMSKRYDAFVFFDETSALSPLAVPPQHPEMPETFPSGM